MGRNTKVLSLVLNKDVAKALDELIEAINKAGVKMTRNKFINRAIENQIIHTAELIKKKLE